jgi:hypothetical protein
MSIGESYEQVLNDLETRHRRCSEELKMLDGMISNLRQFIAPQRLPLATPSPQPQLRQVPVGGSAPPRIGPASGPPKQGKYSHMSVRWAILYLLAEHSPEPMGRTEIAEALRAEGITSNAQSFASNVSAVLSVMAKERAEVEQVETGFQITPHGREVWENIKHTPQWMSRPALSAS